jgi:hypothetical protein
MIFGYLSYFVYPTYGKVGKNRYFDILSALFHHVVTRKEAKWRQG